MPTGEETINNENNVNNLQPNDFSFVVTVIKIVIVVIFVIPLADYTLRSGNNEVSTKPDQMKVATIDILNISRNIAVQIATDKLEVKKKIRLVERKQPVCFKSFIITLLDEILKELIQESQYCTPSDYHNINKHKISKTVAKNLRRKFNKKTEGKTPAIVNYAVGIILMVSLGAAVLELYRAKQQPAKKDGKNSLSRKCSLADLTLMKHHRKEMMRRDSLMDVPEENLYSKQLGNRPSPLHRQCSFPVGPSSFTSMDTSQQFPMKNRRSSIHASTRYVRVVDGRPAAVLEGRRHSIISDGRQPLIRIDSTKSIDSRELFVEATDYSLDRKYHRHGRRMHRH